MATPYTVWHAMEWESLIEGGVKVSARQQRDALRAAGVTFATERPAAYDVLHLNFPGPASLARLLAAGRAGVPVVMHAHSLGENIAGTYRFSNALSPAIVRYFTWFYDRADAVVAVSEYAADRLAVHGVDDVTVVSNGVDGAALDGFDDLSPRGTWGVADDDFAVVNLSQVYDLKGVGDFCATAERLPDAAFRWFGERHRYLAPRSTKRTVANAPANVRFPGFVDDKREAFALADAFLFPSHRETQGIAVLEAAYCGVVPVVRDIPGLSWLTDGEHCLKADSPAGFAGALRRLRDDSALRERLGANARELAREHSLDRVGTRLRDVYESVLDRP